jgi:hypothetical protein
MSVNTSITGAAVVLVLVMLIAGSILGLALANADVMNPHTGRAQARQIEQETDIQVQRAAIDLEYYQRELEAEAQAREEQRRQEAEFRRQQQEQELAYRRERQRMELILLQMREVVLTTVLGLAILAVGGGIAFCLVALGRERWMSPDGSAEREWRMMARRLAQANERLMRYQGLARQPSGNGDGRWREVVSSEPEV